MTLKIMGWNPPQRPQIVKEIMKTPGHTKVQLSLLLILATSSVTSTALQISSRVESTLEESISYRNENLKEASDVLRQSLTGSGITEALTNLNKTLKNTVEIISEEKSYPSTQPLEK